MGAGARIRKFSKKHHVLILMRRSVTEIWQLFSAGEVTAGREHTLRQTRHTWDAAATQVGRWQVDAPESTS